MVYGKVWSSSFVSGYSNVLAPFGESSLSYPKMPKSRNLLSKALIDPKYSLYDVVLI